MKLWIPMLILFLSVTGLCIWDGIYTSKTLNYMEEESNRIYSTIISNDISKTNLKSDVEYLNNVWTKKMDILSISISRKDLQPISDYLQYLCAAVFNNNQEEAVTYSRLLAYNIEGLQESTQMSHINLL